MNCIEGLFRILQMCNESARGGWRAIGIIKECSSYIGAADTTDLSDRKNGIEKIEER